LMEIITFCHTADFPWLVRLGVINVTFCRKISVLSALPKIM